MRRLVIDFGLLVRFIVGPACPGDCRFIFRSVCPGISSAPITVFADQPDRQLRENASTPRSSRSLRFRMNSPTNRCCRFHNTRSLTGCDSHCFAARERRHAAPAKAPRQGNSPGAHWSVAATAKRPLAEKALVASHLTRGSCDNRGTWGRGFQPASSRRHKLHSENNLRIRKVEAAGIEPASRDIST